MKPRKSSIPLLLFLGLCISQLSASGQPVNTPNSDSGRKPHTNAVAELQRLLEQDDSFRKAGDSMGRLKVARQLRPFLHEAGDAILATAHAWSVVRDSSMALATLNDYARMGLASETISNGSDKKFAWLSNNPRFKEISVLLQQNATPLSHAEVVVHFADTGYLAEDIDYDEGDDSFLFTSILQHAVFRLSRDGACRKFASSPDGHPMMAIKIDRHRHLVWATEIAMPGFDDWPDTAKGCSSVVCFDLRSGALKQKISAPDGAQWGDLTLDAQGNPIVSDGQSGAIFQLRGDAWRRLDRGDFISPQTMALAGNGKSLIVPDYVRGLAVLNISTGEVSWIRNNAIQPCALNGIDGVYAQGDRLFITQNGVDPERVVQLQLDKQGRTLRGSTIIERATPLLGEPTHGVLVGADFYFIANSGWDILDRHGKIKPGARMTPPVLMRYRPKPKEASPL
ncbi:MAG TPA: hypothetical protein VGM89_08635 [Puia sp.]